MKRNIIAGIIIVIVILLGVYFLLSPKLVDDTARPIVQDETKKPEPTTMSTQQVTKLAIQDITTGTGREVKKGDTVVVNYKGTLLNGKQFDSSYDRGRPFETKIGVGNVIKGWDEGIVGMKVGGKRKLTIPSDMAYGATGAGSDIPPNSPLIFEVELINIR